MLPPLLPRRLLRTRALDARFSAAVFDGAEASAWSSCGSSLGRRGHRQFPSSNRLDTVRRVKVATMIVPITTITPWAEARP